MQDGSNKNNIDLDKLVDALLKERQEAAAPAEKALTTALEPVSDTPAASSQEPESLLPEEQITPPAADDISVTATEPPEEPFAMPLITGDSGYSSERRSRRPKKRFGLFKKREEDAASEEEWSDWGLSPIGHYSVEDESNATVDDEELIAAEQPEVQEPAGEVAPQMNTEPETTESPVDEFPSITPVAETITLPIPIGGGQSAEVDQATKVMPAAGETAAPAEIDPERSAEEQLPDQLSLEEMVRVEDVEDVGEAPTDEDPEERFHRSRLEKVRDFTLSGVEEEENEPEEEPEDTPEEEPVIEDYTSYEETKAVGLELQYRTRTGLLTFIITCVLEAVLLIVTLLSVTLSASPITNIGYLSAQLFALLLLAVLNYSSVMRGLRGLFSMRANSDSLAAFIIVLSLPAVGVHFFNLNQNLPLWPALAGLPILFTALSQYVRTVRIKRSFAFVSHGGEKHAAALIEEEKPLREIGQHVVINGQARVAYFRRTSFLNSFLQNSYDEDSADRWCLWLAPGLILLSVLVSLILLLSGTLKNAWDFSQALAFILCMGCAPFSLAVQVPLAQCSRHMLRHGGFIVGWKAVDDFGKPDALVIDVADLYPDECMLLHGIKTFSGMQIDTAILDAASLSIRSGGPLSLIFRRIIQDKTELLRNVENLVYEQGMGLSGWVDGRRVLVGNRRLLANHDVDVPSADYEARYAKNGRRLVYLSTAGNLSAMFVVSYLPDPSIKDVLHSLTRSKVTVLVRSCDQNVSSAELCENFELDEYYVEVLPAAAGRLYEQLVANPTESAPAVMASNGHIIGTAEAISACRSVRVKSTIALTVAALCALMAIILGAVWTTNGLLTLLWLPLLVSVSVAVLPLLIPLFKRI